jgi:hypothetical protein
VKNCLGLGACDLRFDVLSTFAKSGDVRCCEMVTVGLGPGVSVELSDLLAERSQVLFESADLVVGALGVQSSR